MTCNNIRWGSLEDQIEKREFTKFCPGCKNILETRLEQAGRKLDYDEEEIGLQDEETGTSKNKFNLKLKRGNLLPGVMIVW
jgi:hypothetical protein